MEVAGQSKDSSSGSSWAESTLDGARCRHGKFPARDVAIALVVCPADGFVLARTDV